MKCSLRKLPDSSSNHIIALLEYKNLAMPSSQPLLAFKWQTIFFSACSKQASISCIKSDHVFRTNWRRAEKFMKSLQGTKRDRKHFLNLLKLQLEVVGVIKWFNFHADHPLTPSQSAFFCAIHYLFVALNLEVEKKAFCHCLFGWITRSFDISDLPPESVTKRVYFQNTHNTHISVCSMLNKYLLRCDAVCSIIWGIITFVSSNNSNSNQAILNGTVRTESPLASSYCSRGLRGGTLPENISVQWTIDRG